VAADRSANTSDELTNVKAAFEAHRVVSRWRRRVGVGILVHGPKITSSILGIHDDARYDGSS
jgi:hypothetical protein